jgi:hypothetical protein
MKITLYLYNIFYGNCMPVTPVRENLPGKSFRKCLFDIVSANYKQLLTVVSLRTYKKKQLLLLCRRGAAVRRCNIGKLIYGFLL